MTLPLPTYDGTPETLQSILDLIAQAFVDTGGRQLGIRCGVATANTGVTTSVPHGLGRIPKTIVLTPNGNKGTNFGTLVVDTYDATNIGIYQNSGVNENVFWAALG